MDPDQIRELRLRLGKISQDDLARRLQVSTATVSRWEQGHRKPDKWNEYQLRQLAEELET